MHVKPSEFKRLQMLFTKEVASSLVELIKRLSQCTQLHIAPLPYCGLLFELSLNTPICRILQVAGSEEAIHAIRFLAKGVNIRQSRYQQQLKLVQDGAPLLASFILKLPFKDGIPDDVSTLINHLCDLAVAPYQVVAPPFLPPLSGSKLPFFPNLPQIRGPHCYSIDQPSSSRRRTNPPEDEDKYSSTHRTPTPGIFTIYRQHGICCGFEVMQSHESPKLPFNIFLTRFAEPPATIIYDNCCKLHQYCLNRQPAHFKNMLFFVDRFHWCGHVGCSSGYSLDRYPSPFISTINSQVNEQANPGLQRICLYEARQLHVSSKAFPSNHQNRIKYMLAG